MWPPIYVTYLAVFEIFFLGDENTSLRRNKIKLSPRYFRRLSNLERNPLAHRSLISAPSLQSKIQRDSPIQFQFHLSTAPACTFHPNPINLFILLR